MKTLVVYDSVYGNTEKIAQAIADGLSTPGEVLTLRVADAKPEQLAGAGLLVAGAATQGGRPSPGMKAWLKALPSNSLRGVKVAAFDTRMDKGDISSRIGAFFVKLIGYAAEPLSKALVKQGGTVVIPPEGFFVLDTEGPLREGELERAAAWAQQILARV